MEAEKKMTVEELRQRKIAVWVQLTRDIFLTYGCHDRHIDQLLDDFEGACIDLYHAEGAEQMKETIRKAVIERLHDPDYDTDIIPSSILAPDVKL